jgi:hypothetical protein
MPIVAPLYFTARKYVWSISKLLEIRGILFVVVQLGGLEPPTSCSTDRRSNQLSYNCIRCRSQKSRPELAGN